MDTYSPLYQFLARAFLRPPDDDFLELAADIDELKPFLGGDLSDQYSWLFDFNVYPYASIFLDASAMLSAPWTSFVAGVYKALGLDVELSAGLAAPDHLSAQLEAMAVLSMRDHAAHHSLTFLSEHLLPWLPSFAWAVRRSDKAFYGALANMTLDLVLEHTQQLANKPLTPFAFSEDEVSGSSRSEARKQLQQLLTPAQSGLFLSREDITRFARELELPVRFAERVFMLEQLIGSAADAGTLEALFERIASHAEEEKTAYQHLEKTTGFIDYYQAWRMNLDKTVKYLKSLS